MLLDTSESAPFRYASGALCVYFYGTEDGKQIKVGKTTQPISGRRVQLERERGQKHRVRFLAGVLGQPSDETFLHRYFPSHFGEWKVVTPELLEYITWLRTQPYVAINEDDVERLPLVPSVSWLPNGSQLKRFGGHQGRLFDTVHDDLGVWGQYFSDPDIMGGDFYSPLSWVAAARQTMGGIDLDPASCRQANAEVQATHYYTERDDGLVQPWFGRVWLNPPYGMWPQWTPKVEKEIDRGEITQMCALINSRSLTAIAMHPLVARADAIVVIRGRAAFWGPKANVRPDEGHTSCILVLGRRSLPRRIETLEHRSVRLAPRRPNDEYVSGPRNSGRHGRYIDCS